ncbi:hypothetical protein [Anatilimnocola floriformis]|uniref:hypothetical protein n=1 Tax=Anatilimnocola floriformis TaxID=2948575 RepID=UPI0020C3B663|nr:hypothetical protein [Anatilimnocola floriformis]
MDRSRKASRAGNEITLQYQTAAEYLMIEELTEDRLLHLQALIEELKLTPAGAELLQRRVKLFGECHQSQGELIGSYHHRLTQWFQRDMPASKSPLHPPRQIT